MQKTDKTARNPQEQEAISELTNRWGYRDITTLIAAFHRHNNPDEEPGQYISQYLCVLQTPAGGPVYCRTAARLFSELEKARAAGVEYAQCPAPRAEENMWLVAGNFDRFYEEETAGNPSEPPSR